MTILVNDSDDDDCKRGSISEALRKVEATDTIAEGNLELDVENGGIVPPRPTTTTSTRPNDAKQCTSREPDMVNATAKLNEELPSASAEVDNVVTGVRRSEASNTPHALLEDPLTNLRMVDPVVNPAGDSYERSSLLWTDESIEFYPNRALQSILKQQDDYEKHQHTASASDLSKESLDSACAIGWWYHDPTKHPSPPLPEAFYCPITCDIMVDPWIGPDGSTYEYDSIKAWLAQPDREAISPVTRQALSLGHLRPNHALYELIQWETQRPPSKRHAAVQQWMDSTPNTKRTPRCNHPSPLTVTPLLPSTSSSSSSSAQPSSQNTTSRQSPPTPVSGGTTTSTAVSEEASRVPWWINFLCIIVLLVLAFLFIPLRIALLIAFAIVFFILCHCSCTA
jgi:U-box domain